MTTDVKNTSIAKTDIIKMFAEKEGLTRDQSTHLVNSFLDLIMYSLEDHERIQLTGFGTFKCKQTEARIGRNPRNPAEKFKVPASKQVSFRSGGRFKQIINGEEDKPANGRKVVKKIVRK